jgi:hypothetical protein
VVERGTLAGTMAGREAGGDRDSASCALPNGLATTSGSGDALRDVIHV